MKEGTSNRKRKRVRMYAGLWTDFVELISLYMIRFKSGALRYSAFVHELSLKSVSRVFLLFPPFLSTTSLDKSLRQVFLS